MSEKRLAKTWEAAAYNREENEWDVTELHSYEQVPDEDEIASLLVRQAPPVKISPTRRAKPEGDFDTFVFYGDTHHPFQDERALDLAQLAIREYMPSTVTFLGDDNDLPLFSTYETRPEWGNSTQEGIDAFSERLARVRADIGSDGKIIAFEGNHERRVHRELRKYNAELLGIKQANAAEALGVLTMDFLLRCNELGVEYISGWPQAEYWYSDDLKAYHGRKTSQQSIIKKELQEATANFIHGHGHTFEFLLKTIQRGRSFQTVWGVQLPSFADPEQIPSQGYSTDTAGNKIGQANDRQRMLGLVRSGEQGTFFEPIPITEEGILINGKWYKS